MSREFNFKNVYIYVYLFNITNIAFNRTCFNKEQRIATLKLGIRIQFEVYIVQLTLRRLMSCIYMEHPFLMFLDHTQRRSTVGRTPLDE